MSILRAMNTGASGLRAHGEALGVVGDNIANVNTVGFKRSRASFQDALGRAVGDMTSMPTGAGGGVRMSSVQQMWNQGALLTTEAPTDLALSGDGFFVVAGNVGGTTGNFYTRVGQFHLDNQGRIVNQQGLALQGYGVDGTGNLTSTVGDLSVQRNTIHAQPTSEIALSANLDSNAEVLPAWDPADPGGTSNFSTAVTVYDSLGNAHELSVHFRRDSANAWEWHAVADGGTIDGGTAGVPEVGASGTLVFNTDGALESSTQTGDPWNFVNATPGQTIAFDFGTSIDAGGGGMDSTTQFGTASTLNGMTQDGFSPGTMTGLSISSDGQMTAVFNNGQRRTLGQVAVANFASNDGLLRSGQNVWQSSPASGQALIGTAETAGRGSIVAGALEQSNVDLGQEFVDLIAYQRGFQANSRVITTGDEMYMEVVNLKR